jgi:hypothetical protein
LPFGHYEPRDLLLEAAREQLASLAEHLVRYGNQAVSDALRRLWT